MPPVWGQSASYSRRYTCFTEEWSVCLARGSCRGDKGLSIDGAPLSSIDGDSRTWAKHISRPTEAQKQHKVTKYPWTTRNPIYVFLSHCWRLHAFFYSCSRLQEKGGTPSDSSYNSFGFYIYSIAIFYLFIYDFCDKLHAWIDPSVRFRVQIGYEGLASNIELLDCDIHQ